MFRSCVNKLSAALYECKMMKPGENHKVKFSLCRFYPCKIYHTKNNNDVLLANPMVCEIIKYF